MRIREILAMLGAILLLVGAVLKMSFGEVASYIYTFGATLFAVINLGRPRERKAESGEPSPTII